MICFLITTIIILIIYYVLCYLWLSSIVLVLTLFFLMYKFEPASFVVVLLSGNKMIIILISILVRRQVDLILETSVDTCLQQLPILQMYLYLTGKLYFINNYMSFWAFLKDFTAIKALFQSGLRLCFRRRREKFL